MNPPPAEPFRVLLVDLEGIGRAPAGERFLRHHLAVLGIPDTVIEVTSAGLDADDGGPLHPRTIQAIEELGADASGYVQRTLTVDLADRADLIVCGNGADRDEVAARFPSAGGRAFSMSQLFYLYETIVAIAPLREHAALLRHRLAASDVPDDFDLPPMERLEERIESLAEQIHSGAYWLATVWASMLPGSADGLPAFDRADARVDVDAFGVSVRVVCHGDDPAGLAEAVEERWERLLVESPFEQPEVEIPFAVVADEGARNAARAAGWLAYPTVEAAQHFLTSTVTVRAITARAGQVMMFHAAGLADAHGAVVGFVAPSGTGKTTLTRTLGQEFGYVTDETLVVSFDGDVTAYPKPLSVIVDHDSHFKDQVSADDIGLMTAPHHLRLARLVILDRTPEGPSPAVAERVPLLHGLAAIAEQTSFLPMVPSPLQTMARMAEAVGGVWRVRYREAADVAPLMPALCGSEPLPDGGVT